MEPRLRGGLWGQAGAGAAQPPRGARTLIRRRGGVLAWTRAHHGPSRSTRSAAPSPWSTSHGPRCGHRWSSSPSPPPFARLELVRSRWHAELAGMVTDPGGPEDARQRLIGALRALDGARAVARRSPAERHAAAVQRGKVSAHGRDRHDRERGGGGARTGSHGGRAPLLGGQRGGLIVGGQDALRHGGARPRPLDPPCASHRP
jgi:hypothetical protein